MWPLNEEGALAVGDGSREETACVGCGEGVRASVGVGTGRVELGLGLTGRGGGGDAGRSAWCAVHVELLSTSATAIRSVQSAHIYY
jgi:hypothetical protein